jgi:hypothetical protein
VFTFTEDGRIKFWEQGEERGMMLTESRELALEFAQWLRDKKSVTVEVTEIGRTKDLTLSVQLSASLKHGANCAFVILAIEGNEVEFGKLEPPY